MRRLKDLKLPLKLALKQFLKLYFLRSWTRGASSMLDAEDLSSLVPVPPTDGGRKRRAAPRKSTLRRVPLTAPKAISADDAFGHLSSLTSGMSPRTVDGLIKAVRKEAADYVVAPSISRECRRGGAGGGAVRHTVGARQSWADRRSLAAVVLHP